MTAPPSTSHGFQWRKHHQTIRYPVWQDQLSIFDAETAFDHLRIDEIRGISLWKNRIKSAGHYRGVFTDEIRDIDNRFPLLQQKIAPAQVLNERL
jgi:hypothetical protein